jgi:hypothetical protein
VAEANISEWVDNMNKAFSSIHAGMEASRQAYAYGVGIVFRDGDGFFSNPEPHTYVLHLLSQSCPSWDAPGENEVKEPDHGNIVIYRATFNGQEPRYVPLGEYTDAVLHDAVVVQAIYEDGFVKVIKNRYGDLDAEG